MSRKPPTLCPLRPDDLEEVARLHAVCLEAPWSAEAFACLLGSAGSFGLQAALGHALAGFLVGRVVEDEAEILTLVVAPSCRRRGLARRLVAAALTHARASGASALFLEVAEDNRPAQALYRAVGFAAIGRRARYYPRAEGQATGALNLRLGLRDELHPPRRLQGA
ncbi:MAG: ribosomal protein S18-alanine N-acetyltransferase [Proteobacteria bacterium]|nr:ribosomal protein S18-alanine N-acetyltransferase [Pseudomonadota bacterium]